MTSDEKRILLLLGAVVVLLCFAIGDIRLVQALTGDYDIISNIMTILGIGGA
ncbi:hypothetical protein [Ruminococcus sp.]|uniref:hypothetical protein n=1 Tax=Ruminococcus sp. TaxID=41978 RepID=UPI0025E7A164|nr:hypothetical protein [Ruminococcus sp.]MBQ8966487.1 hypothetical protein [Ruminococcus sp.]